MSVYVVNDLHGNARLVDRIVCAICKMAAGDILIINGDGAGSRGPRMNKIVKIFYEVRRGEADLECLISALAEIIGERPSASEIGPWVSQAVHAGVFRAVLARRYEAFAKCVEEEILTALDETLVPLSEAASSKGVRVFYSPGNCEIVPADFSVDDITTEKTLPPEERFYQRLAKQGYFDKYGIEYVPYACKIPGFGIISSNLLDLPWAECEAKLRECGLLGTKMSSRTPLIVHYPPDTEPLERYFGFWKPNDVDKARVRALQRILGAMKFERASIFFGHIHLAPDDPRMGSFPPTWGYKIVDYYGGDSMVDYYGIWIKPGSVIRVSF